MGEDKGGVRQGGVKDKSQVSELSSWVDGGTE